MTKEKYKIANKGFSSLDAIKKHCRQIKERATSGMEPEPGVRFMLDDEDEKFIIEMVSELHPSSGEILGIGLACVQVGYVPPDVGKPHWGFYAIRYDGSESLFGFSKIGFNTTQAHRSRSKDAKRRAIVDQILAYKEEYFDGFEESVCEATGEVISRTNCHVDHEGPTFAELDEAFFGGAEVEVENDGLNWHIADKKLLKEWQEYHRKNANLRCVTARFNLTRRSEQQ